MSNLYTIKDERTVYCRAAMKGNGGEWNPVTSEWMFRDANDHANASAELYRVTRPTVAMREALQAMMTDGSGALAWGFDPAEKPLAIDALDRSEASKLLAPDTPCAGFLACIRSTTSSSPATNPLRSTRPSSRRARTPVGAIGAPLRSLSRRAHNDS
jgi:hypothetical protein